MSITTAIISLLILGIIIGGVLVLKKTAKKFNLTEQQLDRIKERNKALDKKEQQDK
jgi:uncharacterized membrane-anchored protein YhcB (DUF1043 family)